MNDHFEEHARRMAELHRCHTVILYGSHARGDATEQSDIDLLCVRDGGVRVRDARLAEGTYLDAFIYPTEDLADVDPSLLRIVGGRLMRDDHGFGAQLLVRVQALYDRGPEALPEDERAARIVWAHKTLQRIERASAPEAGYRRAILLTQALEDYFVLRNTWFLGSKSAFAWLLENDQEVHTRFVDALADPRANSDLFALVDAVYGPLVDDR